MKSAILLAAGLSQRMGPVDKMTLPFRDSTVLGDTFANMLKASFDEIIIVCAPKLQEYCTSLIEKSGAMAVKVVVNTFFVDGMTSSIKIGVRALSGESKSVFVCLGDMPMILTSTYDFLIKKIVNPSIIVVPWYDHKRGNPVGFTSDFYPQLLEVIDPNGCSEVVKNNKDKVCRVATDDQGVVLDIDDPNNYDQLLLLV